MDHYQASSCHSGWEQLCEQEKGLGFQYLVAVPEEGASDPISTFPSTPLTKTAVVLIPSNRGLTFLGSTLYINCVFSVKSGLPWLLASTIGASFYFQSTNFCADECFHTSTSSGTSTCKPHPCASCRYFLSSVVVIVCCLCSA